MIISDEEFLKMSKGEESQGAEKKSKIISDEEFQSMVAQSDSASFTDYLRAVPATAVDITLGSVEGLTSAIGDFSGDYDLARNIGEIRTDVNDAIMGDAPESVKSDFGYKLASGLGSTIPYLAAAVVAKRPSLVSKIAANGFFLSSAGQQVRDDYLATQGVTSETATDEQMSESVKAGAIGAIPIALAEKLGAGLILKPFSAGSIPAGKVMERIGQYISAGAGEAATEVMQSGIINSIASYVSKYDEDRPITRGMAESALIGFLVGGGVNAGIDTIDRALTQSDRLRAGVRDGSINANDVIDPDVGSQMTAIAVENGSIPEVDSNQQAKLTDKNSVTNFISKTLTPLSRRLGRAGKEVVREFRKFELDTGVKINEFKEAASPFSKGMLELKKKSPEDYKVLARALANANELAVSLPDSVQKDLEKKAQINPEITRSASEQLLDISNENAQVINEQIGQARKALEAAGLKTRIQIVESGNSYYDPASNTIAISAEQADGTTVAHEYFHAVLGQAVKTDLELQSMTRNMFDSVIRATVAGSSLNEQLKGFVSQYDSNVQNEEFLAQTVGELASQYETLDINTRTRIKIWINQVMQKIGVSGVFKEAQTDAEVIEQLNAFARFSGSTEGLTSNVQEKALSQPDEYLQAPMRATKFSLKDLTEAPDLVFPEKPNKLSLISSKMGKGVGQVDIINIINRAIEENATVTFWGADQLGTGKWKDPVTGKEYDLDGGISYPLSKRGGKARWATAKTPSEVKKLMESDYVFLYSGKPQTMHTFNSLVRNIAQDRMQEYYGKNWRSKFANDFEEIKSRSRGKRALSALEKQVSEFGLYDIFESASFTSAGKFTKSLYEQAGQANEELTTFLNKFLPDLDSMRDGFLKENNFPYLGIYGVFKPDSTEMGGSNHGTYANSVFANVLEKDSEGNDIEFGIPNKVLTLEDVLNDDTLNQIKDKAEKAGRAVQDSSFSGGPSGVMPRDYSNLRKTTTKQIADAIARKKAIKLAKPDPATPEQIKSGAKAARKQLDRSTASVNFRKWMGKGQLIHDDGEPMVLYHGSKQDDITSFKPARSEGLIFFSTNPEFAENWVRGTGGIRDRKSPAGIKQREEREKRNRDGQDKEWERSVDWNRVEREQDTLGESPYYEEMYKKHPRKSRMSDMVIDTAIYPVYLNSKKIFDPRVDFKIAEDFVLREAKKTGIQSEVDATNDLIRQGQYKIGSWIVYENKPMVDFLKTKGYDTMLLSEDASSKGSDAAHETLAVFSPNMIKSATGNNGEYSLENPDIRRQKERRETTATEEEIIRGLSDDGMRILQKYGMTENYRAVRKVLNDIKAEYEALGLDANFIDNYFPRLVEDLNGLKKSYGQDTGIVDQEIRRYEKMTGQTLSDVERQMMYEKLARSRLYRGGLNSPSNMKERRTTLIGEDQMKYYADPEVALDSYIEKMVNAIETKKLIGDAASGKTVGADPVSGRLGEVMDKLSKEGRLREDQVQVIQGAVAARFGQHGSQYGFVKGAKNAGYLATMGNVGSTLTQLGDFYFTMVQNGLIPTVEAALGKKNFTVEDLGIAKDMVEIDSKQGAGMFSNSVRTVFKWTGLTAMDRLAKNTNINAAHGVLTKGAKANPNSKTYKKTLARLKRTQGDDAYKTIADLQNGVRSDYVIEALYNELADVAPISLLEMPESYSANPNLRILYSLKSYTIKQFNFVRERVWVKLMQGIATKNPKMIGEASTDMMKILAFSTLANGSADVLKAIVFNREIDEEDFYWNTLLRIFGITKYTTVQIRKEGLDTAILKTIAPPQLGVAASAFKDVQEMGEVSDMRSVKYMPFVGKLYYWQMGRGVEAEKRLSRLRETPSYPDAPDPRSERKSPRDRGLL